MIWERRVCVSAQVEDALVLLDLDTLKYHALNPTATAVWEILAEPAHETAIVQELCRRYAVDEQTCARSVDRLLQELQAASLLVSQP